MRLRPLLARYVPEKLPDEIVRQLVGDLFGPIGSAIIGYLTAILVAGFITWRTQSLALAVATVAIILVSVWRLMLTLAFRHRDARTRDVSDLRQWERLHFAGTSAFTACLGALSLIALAFTDDVVSHFMICAQAIGYTAAASQRNSSRPLLALIQLLLVLAPMILGQLLRFEAAYFVLAFISSLYFVAMVEIVTYHAEARVRLLATTRELTQSNIHFDAAISNMSHGLCMFDENHRLIVWNKRFCEIYNLPEGVLRKGATVQEVFEQSVAVGNHPGRTAADVAAEWETYVTRGVAQRSKRELPNGRIIAMSHQRMADGGIVGIFEDITEYEKAAARVQHLSTHDDLTGLPNRMMLRQTLNEAVVHGRRYGNEFAVLFVDLDHFKIINDTLGHAAGDEALKEIAARFKARLRASDTVARLGGDEFFVLLQETSNREEITAVARELLSAATAPMVIQGQQCQVTASIGISLFPADAADEESLIRTADAAMYAAKEQGRNHFCFHASDVSAPLQPLAVEGHDGVKSA
jgi:diguanylate cyclase (GGDEF)-like protein